MFAKLKELLTELLGKVLHKMACVGIESDYSTFEKLVYLGEELETAKQIEKACDVFRSRFHNDNNIVQCCAKGVVDVDDLGTINESHCGIIKEPGKLRRYINANKPHRILWAEFVKHLRLEMNDDNDDND